MLASADMKPKPPLILCYSIGVSGLAHDLPLQIQHYRVASVSLWAPGDHSSVLHAMLGRKRLSQGHRPHFHCPCALECQGTMQGVLSSFQSPPRKLSADTFLPGCPQTYLDILAVCLPIPPRTQLSESWTPPKGTVSFMHQYLFLRHSFHSLLDQKIWIFNRAGGKSPKLIGFISSASKSFQGEGFWNPKFLSFWKPQIFPLKLLSMPWRFKQILKLKSDLIAIFLCSAVKTLPWGKECLKV